MHISRECPPKQVKHDMDRAKNYSARNTRSKTKEHVSKTVSMPNIEMPRCDVVNPSPAVMDTVEFPDKCTGLDPLASPFVTHDVSGHSALLQRTEDFLEDSFTVSQISEIIPMPNIDNHIENDFKNDHSDESSVCDDDYLCEETGCSYGPGGPYTGNYQNISTCKLCKGVYICHDCLSIGRHERHKFYTQQCKVK